MIYHSYFSRVGHDWANPVLVTSLIKVIKSGEHSVVFVVTKQQEEHWKEWVYRHKLEEFIQFQLKQPISNRNYRGGGRKLYLYVLSKQPIERVGYDADNFCKSA